MGLFLCPVCDQQMMEPRPHVCDWQKVKDRVDALDLRTQQAEHHLRRVQNAVAMLLQGLPSLEGETIPVSGDWLRRLWNMTGCHEIQTSDPDSFLVRWMATHSVLCEAFDLFRSKKRGRAETLEQRLRALREACDKAAETLGYQDSRLDLTPEDILSSATSSPAPTTPPPAP